MTWLIGVVDGRAGREDVAAPLLGGIAIEVLHRVTEVSKVCFTLIVSSGATGSKGKTGDNQQDKFFHLFLRGDRENGDNVLILRVSNYLYPAKITHTLSQ
jgi:hypothetical protein